MTEEINNNTEIEKNNEIIEEPIKKRRGRPPILSEPKKYKPKDPDYFKKYYHSSKLSDIINCPICSRTVTKIHLKTHMKSSLCKPTLKHGYLESTAYITDIIPEIYLPPPPFLI